jgi:hypothetical protein
MLDPLDNLDASLQDFEPTTAMRFGYPSHHSGFRSDAGMTDQSEVDAGPDPDHPDRDPDSASAGGYSPPAWRRLENGRKSSGFWRTSDNILGDFRRHRPDPPLSSPPDYDSFDDDDHDHDYDYDHEADVDVLARAARTRLPTGSLSPEKGRSPDPDPGGTATTLKIDDVVASKTPVPDNCKFLCYFIISFLLPCS